MKDFMSIGDMSSLFGLNKQTLHYYDRIGLFKADHLKENGHRAYKFEQCYRLASICNMRYLGYSIKSIKEILLKQNKEISLKAMKNQSDIIDKEIQKLTLLKRTINKKVDFVEKESKEIDMDKYNIRHFEDRYYISIGDEDELYKEEAFYYNPTIVFYDRIERKKFGAFIEDVNNLPEKMKDLAKIIPSGEYICGYHKGNHENILETVKKMEESFSEYSLEDWSVHFNIIDQFIENDKDNFVTQIQIRINDDDDLP